MQNQAKDKALALLGSLGIAYECIDHPPVTTMEECEAMEKAFGTVMCKNLFLQNRQGTAFFLLLVPADKPFRTASASRAMGQSRLSFAKPEAMKRLLGVEPGAVTPLGLVHDKGREVALFVDVDIQKQQRLVVHPLVNTASVCLDTSALFGAFLRHTGHTPTYLTLEDKVEEDTQ